MEMAAEERARQIAQIGALLREESTLALATVDEHGEPWVTPVFYLADGTLHLYWLSSQKSRHSENLQRNPLASGTVYRHAERWKDICGVQMRGRVQVVEEAGERDAAVKKYCERFALGPALRVAVRGSTLYRFEPQWIRYIDNGVGFGFKFEVTLRDG